MPGKEGDCLDPGLIRQAGEWLGAMHRLSAENAIPFTSFSPWSMFGPTDDLAEDVCTPQKQCKPAKRIKACGRRFTRYTRKNGRFWRYCGQISPQKRYKGIFL
jgi:hypothetical protein